MRSFEEIEAVRSGTYGAIVAVLDATDHYPMTRSDIIDAIGKGVQEAFDGFLTGDIIDAVREGVREAFGDYLDEQRRLDQERKATQDQKRRATQDQEAVAVRQRCVDAIKLILPVGKENAVPSNELRTMVMRAVGCSARVYDSAHARVTFGQSWQATQHDGTKALMMWRPEQDDDD